MVKKSAMKKSLLMLFIAAAVLMMLLGNMPTDSMSGSGTKGKRLKR